MSDFRAIKEGSENKFHSDAIFSSNNNRHCGMLLQGSAGHHMWLMNYYEHDYALDGFNGDQRLRQL